LSRLATRLSVPAARAARMSAAMVGAIAAGGRPAPSHWRSIAVVFGHTAGSSVSPTPPFSIVPTGTKKATHRKISSGATSATIAQRGAATRDLAAGETMSARDPGIEALGELVAIFDPEIAIERQRVGHVLGLGPGVLAPARLVLARRLLVGQAGRHDAGERHLVL